MRFRQGMDEMIKKITIQEIAAELELSRNTVAKALTNSDTVAYDTRMLVIRKAWEMGYQKMSPSILEEYKLAGNTTPVKTVTILVRREVSVFWNSIIVGISDELNMNNCRMRLSFISAEDERDLVLPRDFQEDMDAVILMSVFNPKYTELILSRNLPVVFLDEPIGDFSIPNNCDTIVTHGRASVRKLTMALIGQGLEKIGFIGDITYCESMRERFDGYMDAMTSSGLTVDPSLLFTRRLPELFSDAEIENIIKGIKNMPEAIVCANDDIALKCMRALKKHGYSVPADVAITGFDNEESLTQADPKLTTVSVKHQMLGKRLVRQLLWRMEHMDFPREIVYISTDPIFRRSSQKYRN